MFQNLPPTYSESWEGEMTLLNTPGKREGCNISSDNSWESNRFHLQTQQ